MKHRKIIRLLVIPAALFVILLTVLVMCRRSAICGETYSDRANYAKTLGYSISADSETVQNIVIPAVFGSVYENYNALQKQCGFDLSLYKGEDAVQYTYIITDYTDDSGNTLDSIRMNLIVVSGRIVGGDICSAAAHTAEHDRRYDNGRQIEVCCQKFHHNNALLSKQNQFTCLP